MRFCLNCGAALRAARAGYGSAGPAAQPIPLSRPIMPQAAPQPYGPPQASQNHAAFAGVVAPRAALAATMIDPPNRSDHDELTTRASAAEVQAALAAVPIRPSLMVSIGEAPRSTGAESTGSSAFGSQTRQSNAPPKALAPPSTKSCRRCFGLSEPTSQFCRFCGTPFDEADGGPSPVRQAPPVVGFSYPPKSAEAVAMLSSNGATPDPVRAMNLPQAGAAVGGRATPTTPLETRNQRSPSIRPALHIDSAFHANPAPQQPHVALQHAPPPIFPQPIHLAPMTPPAMAPIAAPFFDARAEATTDARIPVSAPFSGLPTRENPSTAVAFDPALDAHIVVIAKDGSEGASYPLTARTDLGRTEGQVRFPDDAYLSPRHASIERRGDRWILRDLESVNGFYLRLREDTAAKGVALVDQDLFLVGQQVLRLETVAMLDAPSAAMENGALLFGTPATPRYGRLSVRSVEGTALDVFYLRKTEVVLGRETGDIVFPDDLFLSRRHALVRFNSDLRTFSLADLGSSNGTFVRIRGEAELNHMDEFRIGQQLFRLELPDGVGRGEEDREWHQPGDPSGSSRGRV